MQVLLIERIWMQKKKKRKKERNIKIKKYIYIQATISSKNTIQYTTRYKLSLVWDTLVQPLKQILSRGSVPWVYPIYFAIDKYLIGGNFAGDS